MKREYLHHGSGVDQGHGLKPVRTQAELTEKINSKGFGGGVREDILLCTFLGPKGNYKTFSTSREI